MAVFTSVQANDSTIVVAQQIKSGGTFKKWDFQITDDIGNTYTWEETDEKLNYALAPTETQVSTYIHAYLSNGAHGDGGGTYTGVEKITSKLAPITNITQRGLEGGMAGRVPAGNKYVDYTDVEHTGGVTSSGPVGTFTASDATPSVATGNIWETDTGTLAITGFDGGYHGQKIYVLSKGAITFDVTSTTLKGGSTDLVTASGDMTVWIYIGPIYYNT